MKRHELLRHLRRLGRHAGRRNAGSAAPGDSATWSRNHPVRLEPWTPAAHPGRRHLDVEGEDFHGHRDHSVEPPGNGSPIPASTSAGASHTGVGLARTTQYKTAKN